MTDAIPHASLALQAWLSPAYPVGAYAYSHGLEAGVEAGAVRNRETLFEWLRGNIEHGAGWNDAILIRESVRRAANSDERDCIAGLLEIAALATALNTTSELSRESQQQGDAFLQVTRNAWPHAMLDMFAETAAGCTPYPVCFGIAVAAHAIDIEAAIPGYLFAAAANWTSAAVRLNILGQTAAQELCASLSNPIYQVAIKTRLAGVAELGSCTFLNDIHSLDHHNQNARLFRS